MAAIVASVSLSAMLLAAAWGYVQVTPNMKSFSSAIKGGSLASNKEKILYSRSTGPGVITEQWFTGREAMNEDTRIRIYIDGETEASLDFQLFLAHGIGAGEAQEVGNIPWGTNRIAHEADGGIYNTYRIPYAKSLKVTATHPKGGAFWYIIRGVENYPVILGDLQLPANTRLHLYKTVNQVLAPYQFITLANISGNAGALYQVTLSTHSQDYSHLEACFRAIIDGEEMFLSSGTEDFFLSAYYFNRGLYHNDNSGLTFKDKKGSMSAYKFFDNDPMLFTTSLALMWRCGEKINGADGCPNDFPRPSTQDNHRLGDAVGKLQLQNTNTTAYVWVYQW
ncbi:uncharacterized protein LOC134180488 [Corticium candelabrum]|uniref:uncharacterized protein LOC134180488 n=1 Tax=Corticium candelabrum TaxID=121492 RepID=UPI002E253574|nr:uncharacterized protein LOC134180488 [Corticium candelabrum]